ncbi:hypothetical protein J6590_012064 [Homalodisca vitripennis]|nr:hypothetical protein J6590_012064 [Homalodisca vitripennis]
MKTLISMISCHTLRPLLEFVVFLFYKVPQDGVPINLEENERADDTHYNLKDGGLSLKIAEARSDDTGMYTCVATNLAGRSQASFAVEVLVHPHFLDEFPETELVVSEGERVVLDCSVGGNPEPKVSWKRVELGLPVTQHTMPGMMLELPSRWRVIIPAVRPHHSGTYQCSAVNKLGKETKQFSLRVTAPPELDGPKEEKLELSLNEKAVLQCRVWGTPAPTIVWEYSNSTSGFQTIQNPGFDLRLFELSPLAPSEAGTYKCTAVNTFGTVSKHFNVTISEPPKIEQSELTEELKVSIGSDMSLSCVTSGSPPPVVSWLHNGHLVSSQSLVDGHTHSLLLGPVNTTSGGKYLCVASNKAGVAEKAFKVKVLVPPRISESYQFSADPHVVVVEGLPLTIRCPVTGTPPPNITWHKDGGQLNNTNDLISIKEVGRNDSGNYTCTATNHVGNVSKSFLVDVHTAPMLKEDTPQQLSVLSKTELSLDCSVTGHPSPSILWLNGTHPLSNSGVISLTNKNQTMKIGSINLEHSGHYSCIASNIAGAVEKSFDVDVLEPPSFMGDEAAGNRPSTMQKVMLHRKVMLECPVSGTPSPNITWYKDGEVVVKPQLSEGGQVLHVMNALPRHAGNYSCVAENAAGTTRLFLPLSVIVPLQWSEWTEWTSCSKSCGGGKEVRERECGHNTITASDFVELDSSECVGEKEQIRLCNVLPCQVHGGWGEWTNWTSCSESCGPGTRRRYRHCDSPVPAFGGDPCYGSDGQQEQCIIQPCPLQSQWSEWTSWSRCTTKCGMGTKFRARQCVRGDQLAKDCEGQKLEVTSCFSRMCPVDGKWSAWGPWSQCSSSCLRQRQRLCSKPLYGGKPCIGDNIQIEKCYTADCQKLPVMNTAPKSASLRISGELNGEKVEGMYLDADITQDGPKQLVTATVKDILKAQANWFPYLTFLMPPLPWNTASEKEKANNGYTLTNGNFTEESRFQFATGQELVVRHKGKGVDKEGALKVDIEVVGKVPMIQPTASVVISPYTEDYIQTGPNSLYTSSRSSLDVDGKKHPFTWNRTVVYDRSQGTMPYLVEKLSTDEIASQYNPKYKQLNFKVSSEISRKFHHNRCPQGFRLDPEHHHCSDIDECKEWKKACHKSQICENQFGSYHCQCQPGFRLSPDGVKCIDVNECEESKPCSHNCHNTRGSFY